MSFFFFFFFAELLLELLLVLSIFRTFLRSSRKQKEQSPGKTGVASVGVDKGGKNKEK